MLIEIQDRAKHTEADAALVALVGNPNTGKTTIFNELTGYRQRVGNYPGVTVEKKTGLLAPAGVSARPIEIVDLPGAYGFSARSHDEAVVLDTLTGRVTDRGPDLVVAVVDAVNLRRNLFLTSQLLELGLPVVVALNMVDLAETRGVRVDPAALGEALGVPVVPIVASKGRGIKALKQAIADHLTDPAPSSYPRMPAELVREIEDLRSVLEHHQPESAHHTTPLSHVELLQVLLEPEGYGEERLRERFDTDVSGDLAARRARLAAEGLDPSQIEAEVRYKWIEKVVSGAVDTGQERVTSRSDTVDRIATHPVLGLVLLAVIMGTVFQSIYAWSGPLMDFIDGAFRAMGGWLGAMLPDGALQSLLTDGVIGGVGGVMIFLPQIMILFLFVAILEDCGYMARAAFLLDRAMGFCGLNGKAFIPLISSFACAVPGIMATRTIENRADRFVAILVAPLMSCSARLPVYVLLIAAFVPARSVLGGIVGLQALVLIAMYLVGVVVAVPMALFLRRVVFKEKSRAFLMELPSYKWPSPKTVLYRVYERAREFVVRAGTIIVAVAILVWAMGYYPRPASIAAPFDQQRTQVEAEYRATVKTVLNDAGVNPSEIEHLRADFAAELRRLDKETADKLSLIEHRQAGEYLRQSFLGRIGHTIEPFVKPLGWDWKIGTAVVASFPAREVIIATLGTIYNLSGDSNEESADLRQALHAAKWPDGRAVFNVPVALSVMVFFALCMQCGATFAVIKRETNSWRWPVITFTYMTALGYLAAFCTYRIAMAFV